MSPIDFPDLLQERSPKDKAAMMEVERGRKSSSSSGRLIANLRSRSRSRSTRRRSKSAQRRAASQPPKEKESNDADVMVVPEEKKRRSLSRSSSRRRLKEESNSKSRPPSDFVELTTKKASTPRKSKSPAKRRPSKTSSSGSKSKEWSADIINLVDRDVEDVILNDLLTDNNKATPKKANATTVKPRSTKSLEKKHSSSSMGKTKEDKNSKTTTTALKRTNSSSSSKHRKPTSNNTMDSSNHKLQSGSNHTSNQGSPKTVNRFPSDDRSHNNNNHYSDYETSESESESEDEDDESKSVDAKDLLAQVNARMEQQRLMEEVKELRRVVEKKDAEIEQLTGQLRMAISTKCDLVIAHTELERLHEMDLKQRDSYADEMKRSNLQLMEVRAEVEREFMNELTQLAREVQDAEERRVEDIKEKDEIIRLLEDKIKRMERNALQGSSARPETDKVRFYKKKLGVYDQ